MVSLQSLLGNGVSFATGVIIGQYLSSPEVNYEEDVFTGRTHEAQFTPDAAQVWIERINGALGEGWSSVVGDDLNKENKVVADSEPPFWENDLKKVRLRLSHGLSDYEDNDAEYVYIQINDRQRLTLFDLVV